jgi:SnoaL-like domain
MKPPRFSIPPIPEAERTPLVKVLLEVIEGLSEVVQRQAERIELLEEEIRILKGQKKKPQFKPSKMDEQTDPGQSEGKAAEEDPRRPGYKVWEKKDWGPIDVLLAENFTFTSANKDDHISKSAFKTQCWESQIDFIDHFELKRLMTQGDWAFVKYLCRTKNGKSFRNVEYLQFRGEKIATIECYFGAPSSFPSAVSTG